MSSRGRKNVGVWCLARIVDHDGTYLLPANVAGITLTITKPDTSESAYDDHDVVPGEGPASTFVFTELAGNLGSPDPRWNLNDVDGDEAELGYNFAHYVPGALFPTVGTYQIDYIIKRITDATPASDELIRVPFTHVVTSAEGSGPA